MFKPVVVLSAALLATAHAQTCPRYYEPAQRLVSGSCESCTPANTILPVLPTLTSSGFSTNGYAGFYSGAGGVPPVYSPETGYRGHSNTAGACCPGAGVSVGAPYVTASGTFYPRTAAAQCGSTQTNPTCSGGNGCCRNPNGNNNYEYYADSFSGSTIVQDTAGELRCCPVLRQVSNSTGHCVGSNCNQIATGWVRFFAWSSFSNPPACCLVGTNCGCPGSCVMSLDGKCCGQLNTATGTCATSCPPPPPDCSGPCGECAACLNVCPLPERRARMERMLFAK